MLLPLQIKLANLLNYCQFGELLGVLKDSRERLSSQLLSAFLMLCCWYDNFLMGLFTFLCGTSMMLEIIMVISPLFTLFISFFPKRIPKLISYEGKNIYEENMS